MKEEQKRNLTISHPFNNLPIQVRHAQERAMLETLLEGATWFGNMKVMPIKKEEEKEDNMNTISVEKDYLVRRLDTSKYNVRQALYPKFGLVDDEQPKTTKDLVDRIKAGLFIPPKDDEDERYYGAADVVSNFRWRDPAKVEDKAGFKTADKLLEKSVTDTRDTIMIADPADGLKALQAFETANLLAN